jgi:hypothetical protein
LEDLMKTLIAAIAILSCLPLSPQDKKAAAYSFKGEEFEACSCDVYCPCVWEKDATFEQCRSLLVWNVSEGKYGDTDLKGVTFVVALTKSGKNIVKEMGKWEGVIYVDSKATEEQKKAAVAFLSGKWGKAFAKIDVKSEPMEIKIESEKKSLTIGKIAKLEITALKGGNGKVPTIENPPFSLIPKIWCAKADVHTYDDGTNKWDFSGKNAYYGPFEYKSE